MLYEPTEEGEKLSTQIQMLCKQYAMRTRGDEKLLYWFKLEAGEDDVWTGLPVDYNAEFDDKLKDFDVTQLGGLCVLHRKVLIPHHLAEKYRMEHIYFSGELNMPSKVKKVNIDSLVGFR